MGAVRLLTAAELVDVAEEGSDDRDLPPTTDRQDPLKVCDSGRHGNLVSNDDLTHHVVLVVRQLGDGSNDAVAISLAEGRIVKTVDDDGCFRRQSEAVVTLN